MSLPTLPKPLQPTVAEVQRQAADAWKFAGPCKKYGALLAQWETETAADGSPMVTARVTGPHAEQAMCEFANGLEPVTASAEMRPQVDYSEDGVVACSWRRDEVWVRLWATDTAAAPAPTPLVMPARVAPLPSGRLPYRRNTTTCGTSRAYTEEN